MSVPSKEPASATDTQWRPQITIKLTGPERDGSQSSCSLNLVQPGPVKSRHPTEAATSDKESASPTEEIKPDGPEADGDLAQHRGIVDESSRLQLTLLQEVYVNLSQCKKLHALQLVGSILGIFQLILINKFSDNDQVSSPNELPDTMRWPSPEDPYDAQSYQQPTIEDDLREDDDMNQVQITTDNRQAGIFILSPLGLINVFSIISICLQLGLLLALAFKWDGRKCPRLASFLHHRWSSAQSLALLLALLLIHMPIQSYILLDFHKATTTTTPANLASHEPDYYSWQGDNWILITCSVQLAYLLPTMFDRQLLDLSLSLIWFAVILCLQFAATERTSISMSMQGLTMVALALAFGLLRRRHLKRMLADQIFRGADGLVESKVSMELQRQQQEILLQSVLPAYVAEQVKRNMFKGLEETGSQQQQQQHQQPQTALANSSQEQLNVPVNSLISTALGPLQSVVSLREPTNSPSQAITKLLPGSGGSSSTNPSSIQPPRARRKASLYESASTAGNSSIGWLKQQCSIRSSQHGNRLTAGPSVTRSSSVQVSGNPLAPTPVSPSKYQQQLTVPSAGQSLSSVASSSALSSLTPLTSGESRNRRGFQELFIRTYNNVSLLYGDIVGFTQLCTKLSASSLVKVLNNLFSHFDLLADKHRIMRIKILGDCYYGVSGIPEFAVLGAKSRLGKQDNHAINCVNMGLDMIEYIAWLNGELASNKRTFLNQQQEQVDEATSGEESTFLFELNMRIGIHSGHIHSGVIGHKKWQFDVWSNDVSIAMHCESSGTAGRVQVTEATVGYLKGAFTFEESRAGHQDPFLEAQQIRTFLIKERAEHSRNNHQVQTSSFKRHKKPRSAILSLASSRGPSGLHQSHSADWNMERRIRLSTINTIQQTLLQGDLLGQQQAGRQSRGSISVTSQTTDSKTGSDSKADIDELGHATREEPRVGYHKLAYIDFNYKSLTGLRLDFRDKSIGEMYSKLARPQTNRDLWLQLTSLWILLFVSQLYCPNLDWFSNSPFLGFEPARYVVIFVITLCLMIIHRPSIGLFSCWNIMHARGGETRRSDVESSNQPNEWLSYICCACNPIRSSSNGARNSKPTPANKVAGKLGARGNGLSQYLTASLILILIIQVILVQLQRQNNKHDSSWIQGARLQIIIFVIAIDASPDLIGYPASCLLLLVLLGTCLMLSFLGTGRRPLDLTETSYLMLGISWTLFLGRQVEFANKINFLWRKQLSVDHEELEYISGINKVLLENILPFHVVQHFLSQQKQQQQQHQAQQKHHKFGEHENRKLDKANDSRASKSSLQQASKSLGGSAKRRLQRGNARTSELEGVRLGSPSSINNNSNNTRNSHHPSEPANMRMSFTSIRSLAASNYDNLYHESHQGVAIMFASIPHFYEFYDETNISKQGLGCIALLNEIICDFDMLLSKNKFSRIEKIKTIGSTYMAVAGLQPSNQAVAANGPSDGTSSTRGQMTQLEEHANRIRLTSQKKQNLLCMVHYATSLMQCLNGINKQSFQNFKLRVGLNTGSLIAGVIGAQRPFYDIWGDSVNIASRMESLGVVGRIQVPEETAMLLSDTANFDNTYNLVKRGYIQVKGKGGMVTYYVDKRDDKNLQL